MSARQSSTLLSVRAAPDTSMSSAAGLRFKPSNGQGKTLIWQTPSPTRTLCALVREACEITHSRSAVEVAKLVKLADKICNLRDILASPPANWSANRKRAYFDWAAQVVGGVRGVHPGLEAVFDGIYARGAEFSEVAREQGV
jgi:hypothetical protein